MRQIKATRLHGIIKHRRLILPQLGAPGIVAHEVKQRTGFTAEYGPVRAADLPAYLPTRQATPEMRRVQFPLRDRLALIPVELVHVLLPMLIAALALYFVAGPLMAAATGAAVLADAALFPIFLPWLPTHDFSSKGLILGGAVALPFALVALGGDALWWQRDISALAVLLALPPVTAFLALNFTGATTFTARSGVKREMATYIPIMAWLFGGGIIMALAAIALRWLV